MKAITNRKYRSSDLEPFEMDHIYTVATSKVHFRNCARLLVINQLRNETCRGEELNLFKASVGTVMVCLLGCKPVFSFWTPPSYKQGPKVMTNCWTVIINSQ